MTTRGDSLLRKNKQNWQKRLNKNHNDNLKSVYCPKVETLFQEDLLTLSKTRKGLWHWSHKLFPPQPPLELSLTEAPLWVGETQSRGPRSPQLPVKARGILTAAARSGRFSSPPPPSWSRWVKSRPGTLFSRQTLHITKAVFPVVFKIPSLSLAFDHFIGMCRSVDLSAFILPGVG